MRRVSLITGVSVLALSACTPPATAPVLVADDSAAPADTDTTTEEHVPDTEDAGSNDIVMDGSLIFDEQGVHSMALELDAEALADIETAPRAWTHGTLVFRDRRYEVGLRLKGNTVFQTLAGKPALKIDMNRSVEGQHLYGLPSFYLHNFVLDPTRMHEHLAYRAFRLAGAPAARTAYATLTINDQPYGIYLIVEKQNATFLEQWWEDDSGSVYESGSINWPCDLNSGSADDPCTCFEVDRVGEGDGFEDLQALCRAARAPDDVWLETIGTFVDMDVFLRAQAMEIAVSHFDNYGWNRNNFRVYHEPSSGLWNWTPWSTDLSFGWYPWDYSPRCGAYGQRPEEYVNGYLMYRCWQVEACRASLLAAVLAAADELERQDPVAELERLHAMLGPHVEEDLRNAYGVEWFEREVDCARSFLEGRPEALRQMVETLQEP